MPSYEPVRSVARAKVNLDLAVIGRDAAGYHLLQSLIAFADGAADVLEARPGRVRDRLIVIGPGADALSGDADNLVLSATRAVRAAAPELPFIDWTLDKRLPVAAGIGGGSADAGAALRILEGMIETPVDMLAVARPLGADVPVAYLDRASWAEGRGETLTPVEVPPVSAVLINPGLACPTPAVFATRRASGGAFSPRRAAPRFADAADVIAWCRRSANDLEDAAVSILPSIGDLLNALRATKGCAFAGMSGSGATCFGLYEAEADADAAALELGASGRWVQAVTLR